jgi:glycosyltransferase involved in cell wall biosynthesis
MPLDRDTRARKFAATLARGGYEVIILSPVATGADTTESTMGRVRVVPVVVSTKHRDAANRKAVVRRQSRLPILTREDPESYVTRVAEKRHELRRNNDRLSRLDRTEGPAALGRYAVVRTQREALKASLVLTRSRWRAQDLLNKSVANAWRALDHSRRRTALFATVEGVLPEIRDYAEAFGPVLDSLAPDVVHAHHPFILHTAVRAARRRRAAGHPCHVVYDARENFAGIPVGEQGSPRRHGLLVRQEVETIRDMDAVFTVSDPIARELESRYRLDRRPDVVLNVPVQVSPEPGPTVRDLAGVGPDVPLLVYSGGISRSRGLETLVDAMGMLPDVHLVIVPVPHPHPSVPALLERAEAVGAGSRISIAAPVPPHDIAGYLSGADLAVHPMPGGSPNHDQAMPNKLFEYLHAGLPLVVSDARLMAEFVRSHAVGATFVSGDAHSLAAAVTAVRAEPPTPEHLAGVARRYSWQGQEHIILDRYDELTGFGPVRPEDDVVEIEIAAPSGPPVEG